MTANDNPVESTEILTTGFKKHLLGDSESENPVGCDICVEQAAIAVATSLPISVRKLCAEGKKLSKSMRKSLPKQEPPIAA